MKNKHALTAALSAGLALSALLVSQPVKGESTDRKVPTLLKIPPSGYVAAPETAESREGATIFNNLNCMACHSIRNAGGGYGPLLDAIGSKRSEDFLIAHLSNTRAQKEEFAKIVGTKKYSYHVRISDKSARLLAKYLLTLPEPPGGFVVVPHKTRLPASPPTANQVSKPAQPSPSSRKGEKLFSEKGCIACHSVGKLGGWLGPELDGVSNRLSKSALTAYVTDAQAYALTIRADAHEYPSQMPKLELTTDQIGSIVDYLMTLSASSKESQIPDKD